MHLVANPFPKNLPPNDLRMPDFTVGRRGSVGGESATNLKVWLTVLEEWKDCTVSPSFENLSFCLH